MFDLRTLFFLSLITAFSCYANEITPYKFTDSFPHYEIPPSSRFLAKSSCETAPDVIFYFSHPKSESYPIAILCGGSSSQENIHSIIHFHRYFLKEFLELDVGVITVEQQGINGDVVDVKEFMENYTRTQRLCDHEDVIEYLKLNPPKGWDGKLVFLGVSEGGIIVTSLTAKYADSTIATVNWSGAGDWSWREELWLFLQRLIDDNPEYALSKIDYDLLMDDIMLNPSTARYFLGMTYKYHADAMLYPTVDYNKILTPFLVVAGAEDTAIPSSDAFVEKAKNSGAPITYMRVENMDHYIRKRPEIIHQSFEWLRNQLEDLKRN